MSDVDNSLSRQSDQAFTDILHFMDAVTKKHLGERHRSNRNSTAA